MGKLIRKEAEDLGFLTYQLVTLFARPRRIRMTFTTLVGDTADTVRDYLTLIDPTTMVGRSGSGRNNTYYYLAPRANVYVEVIRKTVGFNANNPENMVNKINIYSKFHAHTVAIASRLDNIFPNGGFTVLLLGTLFYRRQLLKKNLHLRSLPVRRLNEKNLTKNLGLSNSMRKIAQTVSDEL